MRMSKYVAVITVGILMTIIAFSATVTEATPPRFIGFQYNEKTNVLKVQIFHFSPLRSIHYVYRIVIQKNGELDQAHLYSRQPGFAINRYSFNLTAESGDQITVSAFCVLWGYNTNMKAITSTTQTFLIP
jgi:hypothetical protein